MPIIPKRPLPKLPDKRQLKQQLQADVDIFLATGGKVTEVPNGHSGIALDGFNRYPVGINGGQQRTLVPDVVASIEQRRQPKRAQKPEVAKPKRQARKKWIYDDFGEPLRWVWAE